MAEPLNATFFAFRKREKSGVLLRASIVFIAGLAILVAAFAAIVWMLIGPMMTELFAAAASGKPGETMTPPAPESIVAFFWIIPAEILFLFLVFLLMAAYEAACLRWMIRGEEGGGVMGLKLDADTWRVYATYWVWFALLIGVYFVGAVLLFAGGIGAAASGGENAALSAGLFVFVAVIAILLAVLYFAVRLAPAAATSVGRQRFSFFKAWVVSRQRFWALFGSFLLLVIINIIVGIVLSTVAMTVLFAGAFAGLDMTTAVNDPEAFNRAYFAGIMGLFSNPVTIAMLVLYQLIAGAIGVVFYVLFYGVNARAVQAALEEGKIEVAPAG
jgi:hypothetical protein